MKIRFLLIAATLVMALGLVGITLTLAQDAVPSPDAPTESEREAAAAAALELNPPPAIRAGSVFTPPAVITAPLFVGVDDANIFTYLVDPATAENYPLFDGFQVWGAAFDPGNQRLFFNQGPTLHAWPLNSLPATLGLIKGGVSAANLSMVGMAYHNGTLYASRTLNSAQDPEGIYTVDPVSLSATLLITYDVPTADVDLGGLAIDPAGGEIYGTNDPAALRGLVKIGLDGSVTVVAPYPAGENDIDGLAIGDGRAYLVTDAPGSIHVFDLTTLTYTTPITNPWTISKLFSGAAWIADAPVVTPTIALSKTVGTDPSVCATTTAITVTAGTLVTYCYEVTNTGEAPLSRHTLEDSELGVLLDDFPYALAPSASAFITESATISNTTINSATWTAYNPGPTDVTTATATATVTVPEPSINLSKTVGTDPNACAATTAISVTVGTDVTYCYEVINTGIVTVTRHTLEDSDLGSILTDFPYTLAPGASAFITATTTLTQTTVNTATWTAYNPGPLDVTTAAAAATVTVEEDPKPNIEVSPGSLAADLLPNAQISQSVTISNTGAADLTWTLFYAPFECTTPGALLWASADAAGGTTAPGAASVVNVTFNAAGSPVGELSGVLCIAGNDPDEPLVSLPLALTIHEIRTYLPIIIKP